MTLFGNPADFVEPLSVDFSIVEMASMAGSAV
jgi:hypothetical protein